MSFAPKQFIRSVDFLSTENAINTSTGCVNIFGGMSVSKDSYLTNMIVVGNSTVTNLNITGTLITSTGNTLTSSQWTNIDSNSDIYFGTSANAFVGIGTTTPTFNLDISGGSRITGGLTVGNLNVNTGATITNILNTTICTGTTIVSGGITTSNIYVTNGNVTVPNGQFLANLGDTVSAPGFSWSGDTNVGMYRPSGDAIGLVTFGVERMRITSTGNIGINTTSPGSRLEVNGTMKTGDITVGNINFTGSLYQNGSAYLGSQWTTTSGNTLTYTSGNVSINSGFTSTFNSNTIGNIFTTGGSVGIGTTAPISILDVSGTIRSTTISTSNMIAYNSSIFLRGDTNHGLRWAGGGNSWGNYTPDGPVLFGYAGGALGSTVSNGNGKIVLTWFDSGNVGIGTTSPANTLDVSGTGRITTSLTTGALFSTNQTTTNIVSTNLSTGTLNATTVSSTIVSATTITGSNLSLSGNLNVAGTLTVVNVTTTNLTMSNGNALLNLVTSGTILNTGTITSGPLVLRTPNNYDGRALTISTLTSGNSYNLTFDAVSNTANNVYWAINQNTLSSTYSNMLTFYGGNVGINTTQASSKFVVTDTGATKGHLKLVSTTGEAEDNWWLGFCHSNVSSDSNDRARMGVKIQGGGAGRLFFTTGGPGTQIERMTIDASGNVGIGTTAPSGKIHISLDDTTGAGETTAWNSTYAVFGKTGTTGGAVALGFNSASGGSLSALSPNVAWQVMNYRSLSHRFNVTGSGTPITSITFASSGNVGIGTTSPSRMLSLSGASASIVSGPHTWINTSDQTNPVFQQLNWSGNNISMNFDMYYDGAFRNSNASTAWQIYKINNQLKFMYQNGTAGSSNGQNNCLVLGSTGNVGISTAIPNASLELFSSVQSQPRLILSGQEFFTSGSTSTAGIALLCGVNRINNRQLWVADSANLTQNSTNSVIRITPTGTTIDAIATDGLTSLPLSLGNGSNNVNINGTIININGTTKVTNTSATSMGTLIVAGPGSTGYIPSTVTSGQLASFYGPGGANIFSHIDLSTYLPITGAMSLPSVRFSMKDLGANNSDFNILTKNSGSTGTMASRIFINGSGNVGINTTNPGTTLHISGPAGTGTNGSTLITGYDSYGHSLYIGSYAVQKRLAFNHNGTEGNIFAYDYGSGIAQNLVLQGPGGSVGIGSSSPSARVHAFSSDTLNTMFVENNGGGSGSQGSLRVKMNATSGVRNILQLENGTGTVMLVRDDSRVGISTTNPQTKLHIEDGSIFIGDISAGFSTSVPSSAGAPITSANSHRLFFDNSYNGTTGTGVPANKIVLHNNSFTCGFGVENTGVTYHSGDFHRFYSAATNSSTYGSLAFSISSTNTIAWTNTNGEGALKIQNSNAGSSAYSILRIGNNTTDAVIFLNSSARTTDGGASTLTIRNDAGALRLQGSGATNTIFLPGSSTNVGINTTSPSYALHVAGDVYATGDVISFSDARLKSDVETITDALDKVSNMRGVYYTNLNTQTRETGVIAQEISEILPEVVADRGEYLGVAYGNIVGVLIEAIKELKARVVELENQIN